MRQLQEEVRGEGEEDKDENKVERRRAISHHVRPYWNFESADDESVMQQEHHRRASNGSLMLRG